MDNLILFAKEYKILIVLIHALAAAFGLGGVFFLDILFFRFLKDNKISLKEKETINYLSKFFWLFFVILFLSGAFLYFSDMERFHTSSKFLAKNFIVFMIFLNGLFLNLYIGPRLENLSFESEKNKNFSLTAFISGIISFISWLWAFVLGSLRSLPFEFEKIILAYFLSILIFSLFAYFFKFIIFKKYKNF